MKTGVLKARVGSSVVDWKIVVMRQNLASSMSIFIQETMHPGVSLLAALPCALFSSMRLDRAHCYHRRFRKEERVQAQIRRSKCAGKTQAA